MLFMKDTFIFTRRDQTHSKSKYFMTCNRKVFFVNQLYHLTQLLSFHRLNLNTGGVESLTMANSRYNKLNYLLRNSKTYFKFAVDENGLWVIFAQDTEDKMMVAKLNHKTFSVMSLIDIAYPTIKAGNAFIACGVAYVSDDKDRKISYAFDLQKEKSLDVHLDLRVPNGILSMMTYYPNTKRLIIWDNRRVKTCKVKLKVA